jgi:hypothetical protein
MPSACVFCGRRISGMEHAWPQWIGRLLGNRNVPNLTMDFQVSGRSRSRGQWLAPQLNVKVRAVCLGCNNGWMSDLEGQVSTFLSPMIMSGIATVLDAGRQTQLATWATKTAMVFEYVNPVTGLLYYDANERQQVMCTLKPPDGVTVWIGRYVGPIVGCQHLAHVLSTARDGIEHVQGHLETFAMGQMVIQVLASRAVTVRSWQGPWNHVLFPMWPLPGYGVVWPPAPIDTERLRMLEARFVTRAIPQDRPYIN